MILFGFFQDYSTFFEIKLKRGKKLLARYPYDMTKSLGYELQRLLRETAKV